MYTRIMAVVIAIRSPSESALCCSPSSITGNLNDVSSTRQNLSISFDLASHALISLKFCISPADLTITLPMSLLLVLHLVPFVVYDPAHIERCRHICLC